MANELAAWSDQLAATVEMAGQHVVALQNPNNTFAAGILWPMADSAVVVTANHALHQQEIHGVLLPSGRLENRAMSGVPLFPLFPSSGPLIRSKRKFYGRIVRV